MFTIASIPLANLISVQGSEILINRIQSTNCFDQILVNVRTEGLNRICNVDTRVIQSKMMSGNQ